MSPVLGAPIKSGPNLQRNNQATELVSPTVYNIIIWDSVTALQLIAVPKARTENLPFWAYFDPRDRFAHNSMSFAQFKALDEHDSFLTEQADFSKQGTLPCKKQCDRAKDTNASHPL
ncbi:hypothetical protein GGX14DRAFT_403516 [Mycena pura]|uniref:Uncharacterized protein n=1 Tax=Mycena pura TaxID=153505 RepID=A0AAD6Y4D4_9AGAR|nr:hypothetical protein GGX14DRAFT_403516 [Mycena pura]